ncbi:Sorting nexin-3, partial [Chytriomyces hyalinus]
MSGSKNWPEGLVKIDFREQTAEERYGIPENFLEVEVRNPQIQGTGRSQFVDYEIVCR